MCPPGIAGVEVKYQLGGYGATGVLLLPPGAGEVIRRFWKAARICLVEPIACVCSHNPAAPLPEGDPAQCARLLLVTDTEGQAQQPRSDAPRHPHPCFAIPCPGSSLRHSGPAGWYGRIAAAPVRRGGAGDCRKAWRGAVEPLRYSHRCVHLVKSIEPCTSLGILSVWILHLN